MRSAAASFEHLCGGKVLDQISSILNSFKRFVTTTPVTLLFQLNAAGVQRTLQCSR
jgi:hypothetical protein